MNIILNNRPEIIEHDEVTISDLLQIKKFSFKMLVIKVNGQLVKRHEYDTKVIKSGDDVSVFHLITGG
jgi:thiamine biosynthesis protein ThiS